ncbi:hypothetical protein GPECTOR_30g192 [Gonium pectorale]|uniref:Glycosyltransferase 2-like domain-containing protein n=1 Tax=Gonium pectorale TaxID=33097 RepID=A0A150GE27_GONPE|nr:hypothetical protein GPECTOR_30g192 [Gonium pectorale]|eukprot:KXZ48097.1 hypothetical protein GPECTOR_30g192 [Gonium pectorale]
MAKFAARRLAPLLYPVAAIWVTLVLFGLWRVEKHDTIFVSIGAYRDKECAATLLDMFRQAHRPDLVFVGAVTYTIPHNATAEERCMSPELVPYEKNIRRLHLNNSEGKGPNLSRYHGATMYGGQKYLMQIDSHMKFAPGWDAELLRMIKATPSRKAVLTHYPATWETLNETRVPVMCMATWLPEGIIMFKAALVDPPKLNSFRPVPFVAGGFMFVPAWVMRDVPFDPTLQFLFHGDEELYSARLWTHGWELYTPDRNVIFHHYGRENAPKFWNDFGSNEAYHKTKADNVKKVVSLMNGKYDPAYRYGMGRQRTVQQWWQYAGMDPSNHTLVPDGSKFCWNKNYVYGPRVPDAALPSWWGHWLS